MHVENLYLYISCIKEVYRGVFRNQPNIHYGAFLRKQLIVNGFKPLIIFANQLHRRCRLGSKYAEKYNETLHMINGTFLGARTLNSFFRYITFLSHLKTSENPKVFLQDPINFTQLCFFFFFIWDQSLLNFSKLLKSKRQNGQI